jgi:hypothetical protein
MFAFSMVAKTHKYWRAREMPGEQVHREMPVSTVPVCKIHPHYFKEPLIRSMIPGYTNSPKITKRNGSYLAMINYLEKFAHSLHAQYAIRRNTCGKSTCSQRRPVHEKEWRGNSPHHET